MTTPMLFIVRSLYELGITRLPLQTLVGVLVHRIVAPTRLRLPSITLARKILPDVGPHDQSNPCDEKERWKDKELGHLSIPRGKEITTVAGSCHGALAALARRVRVKSRESAQPWRR